MKKRHLISLGSFLFLNLAFGSSFVTLASSQSDGANKQKIKCGPVIWMNNSAGLAITRVTEYFKDYQGNTNSWVIDNPVFPLLLNSSTGGYYTVSIALVDPDSATGTLLAKDPFNNNLNCVEVGYRTPRLTFNANACGTFNVDISTATTCP
jgi:hypothetical protein